MASVMEVQPLETERSSARPYFSAIRWGAIFAGVVSGTASYLLLALLGVAVGLTAVDPNASEPVGNVPLATGIWTGISMLVAAFIGGYVAGHMSGLHRAVDGMLHGFVSWAATTLLYAILTLTALGAILGGTFRVLSEALSGTAQTAAQAAGGSSNVMDQLAGMISGGGQGNVNTESLSALQQAMSAGDRNAAVEILVVQMGFPPDRANQIVDKTMPLLSQDPKEAARDTAAKTADALTTASWWLFIGLLLSLALGIAGGAAGVRASARRLAGDHIGERQVRGYSPP